MQIHPQPRRSALLLLILWFAPLAQPAWAARYVAGAGDSLFVDFPLRGSPSDLQPLGGNGMTLIIIGDAVFYRYEAKVAPDGFITLPSLDPIRVEGLTLEQIQDSISSHMKTFSLRSTVSVILNKPNSQAFVVNGAVDKPGRYIYERPTTLMEAIAMAGGLTAYAKLDRVRVFREGEQPAIFDLSEKAIEEKGLPNVAIHPSDVVDVPRRRFTPDSTVILIFLSAITAAVSIYAVTK